MLPGAYDVVTCLLSALERLQIPADLERRG